MDDATSKTTLGRTPPSASRLTKFTGMLKRLFNGPPRPVQRANLPAPASGDAVDAWLAHASAADTEQVQPFCRELSKLLLCYCDNGMTFAANRIGQVVADHFSATPISNRTRLLSTVASAIESDLPRWTALDLAHLAQRFIRSPGKGALDALINYQGPSWFATRVLLLSAYETGWDHALRPGFRAATLRDGDLKPHLAIVEAAMDDITGHARLDAGLAARLPSEFRSLADLRTLTHGTRELSLHAVARLGIALPPRASSDSALQHAQHAHVPAAARRSF
ncbi:hypothetical protein [uncultured Stenotrophomonas sp.]|uniref:hypothetical protein n=1 Tax=uncultured Stenotrophomonas sp. TaxID=165438 RepID=UPI0025D17995|nr:hypothetical protein [uncultured Stenotrophomonas sp.]